VRDGAGVSDVPLLDRHGAVLHEVRLDPARRRLRWTPLEAVSPALRAAVLASEDRRFERHRGVDWRALAAAGLRALAGGPPRGGSTISMQLAALLDPVLRRPAAASRSPGAKWRQVRQARALEARWSKARILEAYLNLAPFRGELEGVAAAAGVLYGKAPDGVTEAEAIVLAALLRGPNAAGPVLARRAGALREALGGGALPAAVEAAVRRAVEAPAGSAPRIVEAPHAAARLARARAASGVTEASPGAAPGATASPAATPLRSTLDAATQRVAAETLRRHLLAVRARGVRDGAVLVVDNASGEALAYVGGSGALGSAPHVDGVQARRQAGSSLKPFLYGLALERRLLTAASLLEDAPLELAVAGGLYRPRNYDERFRGLVSARTALAASLNVPAVRVLALVGAEAFAERLRALGFEAAVEPGDHYGPALALGSLDVSLWELVQAYRALAAGGVLRPIRLETGGPPGPEGRRVLAPEAAFVVSDILASRESRSATFGLESPLATRFWSAVKTGTSREMRDNWAVGSTTRYTAGVWVGNFSGAPMRDVSGITGAAPIWLDVMAWLHQAGPGAPPSPPAGLVARRVAFPAGGEAERVEWFLAGTAPAPPAERAGSGDAAAPTALARHPGILAPTAGTVVALDPDIPPARQRLVFEARPGGSGLRFRLDGADLGLAGAPVAWAPVPGSHELALVDAEDRVVDRVRFEVRAGAGEPAPPPAR
jgi:penicillin-binding protein 1C